MTDTIKEIMAQYPLQTRSVTLISDKGKKATWSIVTNAGTKVLKKSPAAKKRLLFLLQAVKHLQKNGASIPAMVATRSGNDYSEDGSGNYYVLSDAVEGASPSYGTEDLLVIMKELGRFHLASRGFQSNFTTTEREHLGGWGQSYERFIERMEAFKGSAKSSGQSSAKSSGQSSSKSSAKSSGISSAKSSGKSSAANSASEFRQLYLNQADYYISQGKQALSLINSRYYTDWVNKVAAQKNLCHQDFAAANLIKTSNGLSVIDMDSLTYDLPARDIRKIFNKVMKKHGWSPSRAVQMLRAYREVHPLSNEECQVIYADLLFPHLFYGLTSKVFNNRADWDASVSLQRLKAMLAYENDRQQMLSAWPYIVRQS